MNPGGGSRVQAFVSLDLETTGLDPDTDDIIEVGAVKYHRGESAGSFSTLINPQLPVPPFVQSLTGIRTEDLTSAPVFAAISGELEEFVGGHPIVGHNVGFDLAFLHRKGLRPTGPVYDTFDLASVLLPRIPEYNLLAVCRALGLETERPHRASRDAEMAASAFLKLADLLAAVDPPVLAEIRRIAERSEWPLRYLLRELGVEDGAPTLQSGEPGLEGVNVEELLQRLRPPPPISRKAERQPVDAGIVVEALSPEGTLAATLGSFEPRPEQLRMAQAVSESFSQEQHLIVEAGTGTGKSLAYLMPAALFSFRNGERVVVSTNTINLQEQLIDKDIPDALSALEAGGDLTGSEPFRFAVLKGRGNYLCLRRWSALKKNDSLTPGEAKLVVKVLLWLRETATGDRSEIRLTAPEAALWNRLSAQGFDDQTGPCPFLRRGLCFYNAARQRAEAAHIVVVNHALLVLDAQHGSLIPEYSHLIVDEAHNLEEVATNQLGLQVDDEAIDAFLARLTGSPAAGLGLLAPFRALVRSIQLAESRRRDLGTVISVIEEDVEGCRSRLTLLFKIISDFAVRSSKDAGDYEARLRLTPAMRAQPDWSKIEIAWEDVNLLLEKVLQGLSKLYGSAEQLSSLVPGGLEDRLLDLSSAEQLGEQLRLALASAIANPEASDVYWLSVGNRDGIVRLHSAPLHVGPLLKERIFDSMDTAVLTGATLSTERNFEYVKERLRMEPATELQLGSSFDYPKLALVYIPDDMPEPNHRDYQTALESAIRDVARAAEGRTMVLFTSRASLRNTRNGLHEPLARDGITVLGQGIDGSPRQLLETFKSTPKVVLLGSGSFWEGVDVAGEALSVLVIARIPFNVPTEPIFEARSQQFEDPFSHYAVPQAVLRFRQGFGRLIRRKTDRGVLVVLDRRITSRTYGTAFLDSIPGCSRKVGPASDLPHATVQWLRQLPLS